MSGTFTAQRLVLHNSQGFQRSHWAGRGVNCQVEMKWERGKGEKAGWNLKVNREKIEKKE